MSSIPGILKEFSNKYEERIGMQVLDIAGGISRELTIDGLHPTAQGHEVLGRNLAESLKSILYS